MTLRKTSLTPRRKLANTRKSPAPLMLEPLEVRALFSVALAVTGNTHAISSGDITPSVTDFTDFGFMSTKANALIGKLTRSFKIINAGDGTLVLTGGTKPITITGPNAKDFSIVTLPATSIAAGTSNAATFVIAFAPKGTGLRKATITIPSNDTGTPAYTFAVQGTGIATTNFTSGLQIATTSIGTGTDKAIPGSQLTINYTEYLMNGTKIASSLDPGGTPFQFNLGIGQVIPGWDQALIGLKKNETRVLIVPASLAFGHDGSGLVPPDAPLIYVISDTDLVQPQVAISGNNVNIAFNDSTPSATDGTLIGTTAPGSFGSISMTFKLTNAGQGSIFYPVNNIVITGKNAKDFTTTLLTADSSGTYATFDVVYHPPKNAGTSNAVVNVITNDPLHPDFSFSITGVETPFQDLTTVISTGNYAGPILTGAATKFKIPVKITNNGNFSVPSTPIAFDVYLHNATGGTDTLISSATSTALKNLAVGKASTVNLSIPIPITVPTGTYEFLVKLNADHNVTETDYTNNNAQSPQILSMTQGFYNLTTAISSTNFPANVSIISGSTTKYTVPFTITNTSNLPISSSAAPITFNLYARNATSGVETLISSFSTTGLRNLAVGKAAKLSFSATLPITLPTASYNFEVKANEDATLTETNPNDNTAISGQNFSVTQGFLDLFASLGTTTLVPTISGGPAAEKIQIYVINNSNLVIPANAAPVSINLYLHSATGGTDTLISSTTTTAVRNLGIGKTLTINLNPTIPLAIETGNFQFHVTVNENNALTESTHANNDTALTDSFVIVHGFNNITGNLSTSTFTATPIGGAPLAGTVKFVVNSIGNLVLPANQKLVAQLVAVSDADSVEIPIGTAGTVSLASWASHKSATFSLTRTLVTGLTAGSYHLAVRLAPTPGLSEPAGDNLLEETLGAARFNLTVS